ncbi:anti-sigma-28 factor, FlgM family [Geosporobacter subterraneus DSM 17957]|uniref:Negative regulator of flagellin synthesis n=1 Tax=Geosporobacter subterraneus DSM 17957 TaxID=1121919 RepID=A0A1M6CLP4_9FIRM|nr:flagellar biosynthesis anti-sigma factor FlgM [Geosporobacter subterraneus]SHI61879.1 anti-sigma-28 factor, FlgM family [Geosporobacter subterraneus DSM 17957]
MKITNNPNIQKVLNVYRKNTEGVSKSGRTVREKDKVEISEQARAFQVAYNAYKKLPEIRADKVEDITRKIQSGNYNPSAEEIVESMFDKKI